MYNPQQLIKGMYAAFLPHWLSVFPRDRLLLLRTEDYKAAPQEHVQVTLKDRTKLLLKRIKYTGAVLGRHLRTDELAVSGCIIKVSMAVVGR